MSIKHLTFDNDHPLCPVGMGQEVVMFQREHGCNASENFGTIFTSWYRYDQRLLTGANGLDDLFYSRAKDTECKPRLKLDLFENHDECFVGQ